MATKKSPTWQVDWAGRHGTLHGTCNVAGAVVAVACVAHWLHVRHDAAAPAMQVMVAAGVFAGVVGELVRAGFSRRQPPVVTVIYRIACWVGAGIWLWAVIGHQAWTVLGIAGYLFALVAAAAIAGALAALADDTTTGAPVSQLPDAATASRGKIAEQWERIVADVCDLQVRVAAVQQFTAATPDGRPAGYTVQARCPEGRSSWKDVARHAESIENYLSMGDGCGVRITRGMTRKDIIIDVTTINVLAEEQLYPEDYGPLTIHEPLPMMVTPAGDVTGPVLREHCMGIFGEAGSGKSNTAQVVGVGIARMTDALLFDLDPTGTRLSHGLLAPFLRGETETPAVCWSATSAHEGWLMLRALQRAGYARNTHYGYLAEQVNDDKCPISEYIPQLILRGDEITHFAGRNPDDPGIVPTDDPRWRNVPALNELARSLVFDQRWGGIRCVLFGLRGTDDVVTQQIQSQLHALGILRVTSPAEFRCVFTVNPSYSLEDARWPGNIGMRLSSSDDISPYHVWRIRPNQLHAAALAVADRQPELDELTKLALNGRDQNGDPFDDLYPGELDVFDTRWQRFFDTHNIRQPAMAANARNGESEHQERKGTVTNNDDPYAVAATAEQELNDAVNEVRRRIAETESGNATSNTGVADDDPVDPKAWQEVLDAWGADPYVPPPPTTPDPPANWTDLVMSILVESGVEGIGPQDIINALHVGYGITIHRDRLHSWLARELAAGRINKPRRGRWAA